MLETSKKNIQWKVQAMASLLKDQQTAMETIGLQATARDLKEVRLYLEEIWEEVETA
jgi:hypothetical protein